MKYYLTISLFLFSIGVQGQVLLTMEEALQTSLANNYDIRISRDFERIAQNNNRIGNAGFLPRLDLIGNSNNSFSDVDNPASFLNGKFQSFPLTATAQLNWVLFDGFRAHISKSRLNLLEEQSTTDLAIVVENTLQATYLAYNNAVLQAERVQLGEEIVALSRGRFELLSNRKELGTATTFDLLQEKTSYFADSIALLQQTVAFSNSMRTLNLVMGESIDSEFLLVDSLREDYSPYLYLQLEDDMMRNNSTLKNQWLNISIRQKDKRLNKANLYPTITSTGGASYSRTSFQRQEDPDPAIGSSIDYYVNFSLNYNLFNGGNTLREIRNARYQEEIAENSLSQSILGLKQQLMNTWEAYEMRRSLSSLNNILVEDALLNLQLGDDKFRIGVITSFEYRDTENAYLSARIQKLDNLAALNELYIEIIRLTGGLVEVWP